MKTTLLLLALLVAVSSQAQKASLQIGAVTSFFGHNENGYGIELAGNKSIHKNISTGIGIQFLKLNPEPNLYLPIFATFKIHIPVKKFDYFFHVDPGYGIHSYHDAYGGPFNLYYKNIGGFYFGTGAGLRLRSKMSPYINFQYSIYGFRDQIKFTDEGQLHETVYVDKISAKSFTITAGIWLSYKKH